MYLVLSLLVLLASSKLAPLIRGIDSTTTIEGSYIVVFKQETPDDIFENQINSAKAMVGEENIEHVYRLALKGFSSKLDDNHLLQLRRNPFVEYIESDQVMRLIELQDENAITNSQQQCALEPSDSWGQTRVSQSTISLNGRYFASSTGGSGVDAYIVDTGVYVLHSDFQGRAKFGFKASPSWSDTDANGHGTHVASTVGGKLYGIAKRVSLIAVKVLGDNGSGSTAGVIAGVDYVVTQARSTGKPSTANLSLGGAKSTALNSAVNTAVASGVTFVVAAGNDNSDACNYSPASAASAITVGATDVGDDNGKDIDVRSIFSNYGKCVDVFGPGTLIKAAWIGSQTATRTISGTSMASPHVCGVACLILGDQSASPADVFDIINSTSNKNMIDLECTNTICTQSPNSLVYNGCSS